MMERAHDAVPPLTAFEEHLLEIMDAVQGDADFEDGDFDAAVDDFPIDDDELDEDGPASLNEGGVA